MIKPKRSAKTRERAEWKRPELRRFKAGEAEMQFAPDGDGPTFS